MSESNLVVTVNEQTKWSVEEIVKFQFYWDSLMKGGGVFLPVHLRSAADLYSTDPKVTILTGAPRK